MKIAVAGGNTDADYLIGVLSEQGYTLRVINADEAFCACMADKHGIPVYFGDPCREEILKEAQINSFELIIALQSCDADNLSICQIAKKTCGVKRAVCTLSDPKNADVFKQLGIDCPVSCGGMIAELIETITESLSCETQTSGASDFVTRTIRIEQGDDAAGKKIAQIRLSKSSVIGGIIRKNAIFVPDAQTVVRAEDTLLILNDKTGRITAIAADASQSGASAHTPLNNRKKRFG